MPADDEISCLHCGHAEPLPPPPRAALSPDALRAKRLLALADGLPNVWSDVCLVCAGSMPEDAVPHRLPICSADCGIKARSLYRRRMEARRKRGCCQGCGALLPRRAPLPLGEFAAALQCGDDCRRLFRRHRAVMSKIANPKRYESLGSGHRRKEEVELEWRQPTIFDFLAELRERERAQAAAAAAPMPQFRCQPFPAFAALNIQLAPFIGKRVQVKRMPHGAAQAQVDF